MAEYQQPGHAAQQPGGDSKGAGQTPAPAFAYSAHEEEHFALLVNGVTEYALFMLDPHGLITNWNTGAERIKGYRAAEIIGKHFSIFYTEGDRQADVPAQALRTALQKGMYEAQGWRVRKDGTRFMANVVVQPLRNSAGDLLGFAKLTRDVSERFHQRRALEEAKAALARSQKLAAFGPLSDIAHDLNNLLQVIRNSAELLRRRVGGADAEVGSLVDMVRRNTESAANLTRQLMVLARARPSEPSAINVNELVAGMAELLRELLGDSVTIETVLGGDLWWVSADPDQLKVAILNVVVNARNALPHRGKLTVRTANFDGRDSRAIADNDGVPPGEYVTIAVSDTGAGMTSEIIAKALDASASFFGTESATQLGMSQVYSFINQVGGHLRIQSAPGTGTTVKVYLPRLQEPAAPELSPQPALAEVAAAQGAPSGEQRGEDALAGLRVLIVEDESLVALLIEDLLEQLGCTVAGVVSNVRNALDMATTTDVDLALLDISVGGQSVYPVAQALQSRGVPFVFMSGYSQLDEPWRGRPIVQKPFDIEQLRREMERALRSA